MRVEFLVSLRALESEVRAKVDDPHAGVYQRPLSRYTLTPNDGGLRVEAVARNPFSGAESALPTYHGEPIAEQKFRITNGALAGSSFDFILQPDGSVRFLRFGGRVTAPAGPHPPAPSPDNRGRGERWPR